MPENPDNDVCPSDPLAELARIVNRVEVDAHHRSEFVADPRRYLLLHGVADNPVQLGPGTVGLLDLLESVDVDGRVAVARTIAARAHMDESSPDRSLIVPVAAVALVAAASLYVAANVIIYANLAAGANAGAMANVRGQAAGERTRSPRVVLGDAYLGSPVCALLDARGYSGVRQAALLKTLLDDSTESRTVGQSAATARLTWEGHVLEIDLFADGGGVIEVGNGRLVASANV